MKDLSQRSSPLQSRPSEPPGHSGSWFLLTLCALLAITAGCKADNTLQHIQHKQVLTVATLNGPATYYENKLGPTGFEYALAREFADNLGVELDIRTAYTPGQLFRMLDRNRADIAAAGLAATSERVEHYRFSFPYFESTPLVVYREGTLRPRKIEDILERDIMVLENSQHAHLLRQLAALQLEKASRGSLDVSGWLDYFADTVNEAQEIAREEVDFVLAKTRFYEAYGDQLNDRQARMVSRIFAEGRKGFEGGITTRKYEAITKCPNRTASRDLSDLVAKGVIMPLPGGGRTTRYELAVVEPARFGSGKK